MPTALAVLGHKSDAQALRHQWLTSRLTSQVRNLRIEPDELAEREHAMHLAEGKRATILWEVGGAALLFQGLQRPPAAFLMAGSPTPGEVMCSARAVRAAEIVIVPVFLPPELTPFYETYPQIGGELARMRLIFRGWFFAVYAAPDP